MIGIGISIASVIVGIVATVIATRYYYRRSVAKQLTPFLHFQSNVLDSIDDEVKSDLDIEYKGVKVERLQQIQFLIANTGERSIKSPIEPLRLEVEGDIEIVDGNILHIHPEGRHVELEIHKEDRVIDLHFKLLNKDEFFVVKFLINGAPNRTDYQFSIVAEDLPPTLNLERLNYNQVAAERDEGHKKKFQAGEFAAGLVFTFFAIGLFVLSYFSEFPNFPAFETLPWTLINELPITLVVKGIGYVFALLFGVIGMGFTIASFEQIELTSSKKFTLPREISGGLGPDIIMRDEEFFRTLEERSDGS